MEVTSAINTIGRSVRTVASVATPPHRAWQIAGGNRNGEEHRFRARNAKRGAAAIGLRLKIVIVRLRLVNTATRGFDYDALLTAFRWSAGLPAGISV